MESLTALCLFLLCGLLGAELTESVNSSDQPQSRPPDVHAVLREMSAKLAVLQFKMEQLQTLNQGQAAELNNIKTELNGLNARTTETENHVDSLKRDREVGQVAFSASLLATGSGHTGPFTAQTTLVFRNVVTNIGNAYNSNTGFFIAPVKGAYHFEFHIYGHGDPTLGSGVLLVKNGQNIFTAWEHQTSGSGTGSNGATLQLEAGDVVLLSLAANTRIHDNEVHLTTFSGHLLFTM